MPDLTKCEGTGCPLKEKCERYISHDSEHWQSYFIEIPYEGDGCEYYYPSDNMNNNSFTKIPYRQ